MIDWHLTEALIPARRRGEEVLDDASTSDAVRDDAMHDLGTSNFLFGGRASLVVAVRAIASELPASASILDVGTGHADLVLALRDELKAAGRAIVAFGLDAFESIARAGRRRVDGMVVGDVRGLPIGDNSVDLVTCSQLLHHFEGRDLSTVLGELNRVSRGWVIVSDIRRSWLAAAGFWLASLVLGFHPVTRRDGVVSVFRGFTTAELEELVRGTTGQTPRMRRGAFWRVTATWRAQ